MRVEQAAARAAAALLEAEVGMAFGEAAILPAAPPIRGHTRSVRYMHLLRAAYRHFPGPPPLALGLAAAHSQRIVQSG